MTNHHFKLRALEPSDGPALANLITEFDGDMTTRFLIDPVTAILFGTEFHTAGVVVEGPGVDGLVGLGTVRFSNVLFNGEVLPLAFLDGLKVHQDFRGRGLGFKIASWRIQHAREVYGDGCVIATGMLQDNFASRGVAKKWCREFIDHAVDVVFLPVRTRRPAPVRGITVREIATSEYQEFSHKQNEFYKNYNLYPPADVNSIANSQAVAAQGKKPYRFFVAVDAAGHLLAGAQTWARGSLKSDTINHLPKPVRLLNSIVHMLPPDSVLRDIAVGGLWYLPGQMKAAQFLWEGIRWECKSQGTTITASFDPRDPAKAVATLKPWHQPRPKITLAIHGPAPIDREKLVFGFGRV